MGKIALVTKLGHQDEGVRIDALNYKEQATLNILVNNDKSEVSLNGHYLKELKKLKLEPSEIAMDLLVIASSMYAADTRIKREKFADDSWTREIELFIPVSIPDFWNFQINLLTEIFGFLTGDIWNITFRSRTNLDTIIPRGKLKRYGMPYKTDTVCLFSGGMDSFIGAINLLSKGIQPLFLGHSKSPDVSPYQKNCENALQSAFPEINLRRVNAFLRIPKQNLFNTEEKTERGRSFLFLSLGGITASALAPESKLIVPENGLISLNLPLTPLRVGSHSTRTTHPYYISLMQRLFDNLHFGVSIENPYQFKTKGEMLAECANIRLVQTTKSMSCSHPAGRHGEGTKHCGYCVPCIIRKASFLKIGAPELSSTYKNDISTIDSFSKGVLKDNVVAFKYIIEKAKRNPDYIKTLIRATGPLGEDIEEYVKTYTRGLSEVENLLSTVNL